MVHSSEHYVPINGYREDNDDFQRYVRDLNVLLTYKQILNMFASNIRQTYTHFSLALQANRIPRNMIPRGIGYCFEFGLFQRNWRYGHHLSKRNSRRNGVLELVEIMVTSLDFERFFKCELLIWITDIPDFIKFQIAIVMDVAIHRAIDVTTIGATNGIKWKCFLMFLTNVFNKLLNKQSKHIIYNDDFNLFNDPSTK